MSNARTILFVPGDRPERFDKALAAGPDLVVLDLEDAVAADRKELAREHVVRWLTQHPEHGVRINGCDTAFHDTDLAALRELNCTVMVPKAEPAVVRAVTHALETPVIALVETARGILEAHTTAAVAGVARLAFGSFDLASQLGVDPEDGLALAGARGALVLASAAYGLTGPIDGVSAALRDDDKLTADVLAARRLGFAGKLCVHPQQVRAAMLAMRPSADELRWAQSVIDATDSDGVVAVDGAMIDKPVVDRAQRILRADADAEKGSKR